MGVPWRSKIARNEPFRTCRYAGAVTKTFGSLGDTFTLTFVAPTPSEPVAPPIVLVMDDDALVRETAVRHLHKSGYATVEAEGVDAALQLLRTTNVVAAMLDMRLPDGQTGLDLLSDLRELPELREIPVLIVTGCALSDTEVAAIAKQRGYVFFKPEGMRTIVTFLDHLTGRDLSH